MVQKEGFLASMDSGDCFYPSVVLVLDKLVEIRLSF